MPLFGLSTAFLAGIVCTQGLILPAWSWVGAAGLLICAAISLRFLPVKLAWMVLGRLPLPLLLAAFCLGAARSAWARPVLNPTTLAWYNDRTAEIVLEGVLVEPPSIRDDRSYLKLSAYNVQETAGTNAAPHSVNGLVRVTVREAGDWRYGDVLRLRGRLRTPPSFESFDYAAYLAGQGVASVIQNPQISLLEREHGNIFWAVLYRSKAHFLVTIYRILPDPEASLLAGILLGEDNNIPPALVKAFQDTGTSHIIAISGFNIGIVAGFFSILFGRLLGRRKGFWAALLGIALYTLLVGAGASVVRAAVMGGLALFARQIGRRQDGLNTLAFTAALMCAWNPWLPWDAGFQLSFAATLGLILYAQPFSDAFGRFAARFLPPSFSNRITRPVSEYVLFTFAAQLTTLPLILYHFQRLSLSSLLVNPLVLPAQPPLMILGGAAVAAGALILPLGKAAAILVYPFLLYTIRMVEGFASLSGGAFSIETFPLSALATSYTVLLGLTFLPQRLGGLRRWFTPAFCSAGLCVLSVAVWQAALRAPDGRLSLTVLSSGGGNAILLRSPGGKSVLIGGGSRSSLLSAALGRRLSFYSRRMDYWLPAGTRSEQVKALAPLLERYPPRAVLWLGNQAISPASQTLTRTIQAVEIPFQSAEPGQILDLGDGVRIQVLQAEEKSAAVVVIYGNFRAVVVSGSGPPEQAAISAAPQATALLFLMQPSAREEAAWQQVLRPFVVLLPEPEKIASPDQEKPANVLRLSEGNWIKFSSDGKRLWAEEGQE